jgi:RNA polymerase sigma-70 factor (ECF subfamily)
MQDETELARLYDEHAQALFGFLLNLTRDEDDTRDVLQEVFVKLARYPALLEGVRDPRGFLVRLAHNAAIDLVRRRGTRTARNERYSADQALIFDPSDDRDEQAFRTALDAALQTLPSEQRAVLHLKLWEGRTFEQIAEVLSISPNTAASRYRYGLDKLRQQLRPLYDDIQ